MSFPVGDKLGLLPLAADPAGVEGDAYWNTGLKAVRVHNGTAWQTLATSTAAVLLDTWHAIGAAGEPAFQNAWVNFGAGGAAAAFRKDPFGVVRLRGLIKSGAVSTAAFTLPVGYRPPTQTVYVVTDANGAHGRINISTAGVVTPDVAASTAALSLEGITFDTESVASLTMGVSGFNEGAYQAGVLLNGDCALTINSTSQVTIAAGTAYVTSAGGLVLRTTPGSTVLSGIPAAAASNFRLDQVVVDSSGIVTRLAGTAGTTPTLANRTGAAAIPAGSQLLHDILVTSGGVLAANVRDRRPWARGASHFYQDAGPRVWAVAGGTTAVPLRRIEIGPNSWLQILLTVNFTGAAAGGRVDTQPVVNGSGFDRNIRVRSNAVAADEGHTFSWSAAAAQGSNTVVFNGQAQDGATNGSSMTVTLIEHVRPNANNGTV